MPETETHGTGWRKRYATLLKKSRELSILCDAEVAVIAFTNDGKLHEYSSKNVNHTLTRYNHHMGRVGTKMKPDQLEQQRRRHRHETVSDEKHLHALKEQHSALELDKLRRTGKALDGLSKEELYALEQEQKGALVSVLKKKEELLVRLLHRSKEREQQAIQETEILKKGIEERRKKIPYLKLFPETCMSLCTSSKAVAVSDCTSTRSKVVPVSDCTTQDMEIDLLRLKL